MPITFVTFIIGSLALAGFPLTAGFFSKDEILVAAQVWSDEGLATGAVVFWLGLAGAMVTTFYMARSCFLIFWGEYRGGHAHAVATGHDVDSESAHQDDIEEAAGHHAASPHESGWQIVTALVVLTVLSFPAGLAGGFLWDEFGGSTERNFETWTATHAIEETRYPFLAEEAAAGGDDHADDGEEPGHAAGALSAGDGALLAAAPLAAESGEDGHAEAGAILHGAPEFHADVFVLALLAFLVAVGGAWAIYGRGQPERDPTFRLGPVSTLLVNKYYFDDLGYRFVVVPIRDRLSPAASWSSNVVIDGIVRLTGGAAKRLANATYDTLDQKVIDGGINGAAFSAAWWSDKLRRIQSGDVQRYAGALLAGVIVLVLVFAAGR